MVSWPAVPLLKPFRALRYDEGTAGPLDDLVAPPYDVITPEARDRLLARSPWNAVRLVRPDDPAEAARELADWRERGVLVREERPAVWLLEEEFTGPDGVRRIRRGIVARVRLRAVRRRRRPPARGHVRGAEGGAPRLLRATRVKPSPIFLLHHGGAPTPVGEPGPPGRAGRRRQPALADRRPGRDRRRSLDGVEGPLLIADGHHRYETALRFHEEDGSEETAYVLAVLVGHRRRGPRDLPDAPPDRRRRARARRALQADAAGGARRGRRRPRGRRARPSGVRPPRPDGAALVEGSEQDLDTALVDSLPLRTSTTRPAPPRPSGPSRAGRRPRRSSCGRRRWSRSRSSPAPASACPRRARTSSRS